MELRNEWLAPQPDHFIPEERAPGMYCTEVAWDPRLVWMLWRREKSCASARNRDLDHPVHRLVTVKMTLSRLSPTDDMHSKCLLISFLLLVINLLVPINTYTALQGAGFNCLTQHMCWPVISILVQPCWAVFHLFCCRCLHKKIKSCNLNQGYWWWQWEFHFSAEGLRLWMFHVLIKLEFCL